MCVYCSKLKENDSKRIYVQINTYRMCIDIPYMFINYSLTRLMCGSKTRIYSTPSWHKDKYVMCENRYL